MHDKKSCYRQAGTSVGPLATEPGPRPSTATQARPRTPPTATESEPAAQPRPLSKAGVKLPIRKKVGQSVLGPSPTATEGGPSLSTAKGWSLVNLLLGLPPLQLKLDHHS